MHSVYLKKKKKKDYEMIWQLVWLIGMLSPKGKMNILPIQVHPIWVLNQRVIMFFKGEKKRKAFNLLGGLILAKRQI